MNECSALYSTQYGKWSKKNPNKYGHNVKLSPKSIRKWLDNQQSNIYWARDNDKMIGYAIALQIKTKDGVVSWVTQLVVHEQYRHQNVAKNLLHSIWGFTNHFAWGIVSANPYAIRALEKATRRRSDPIRIKHNIRKILKLGIDNLTYISEDTEYTVESGLSVINTCFFVDHANVDDMIDNVVSDTVPWNLGKLEEGWEWLAFTFQDQLPFELSEEEINNLLETSDNVAHTAYSRMVVSNSQKWTTHTKKDVDYVLKQCNLSSGSNIIDWGCGQGRHSIELAQRGFTVTGIDYVDNNIEIAQKNMDPSINITWYVGDCRTIKLLEPCDMALCLYDVIGTYADEYNNKLILENIYRHLKLGGIAFISVMNRHLTESIAKYKFSLKKEPNKLLNIKPSQTMEKTGNIFDPDYYLMDTETGVVYRREQFREGRSLPVELIVRDKRFYDKEICNLCQSVGFIVDSIRFVNASNWDNELSPTDSKAKEILIKLIKK